LIAVILYPQIQENRPKVVRFACDSSAACLPFLVAVDETLFVNNKIKPELVFYSDPEQALADLFAGKTDVGVFPWSTVLKHALAKNETLKVFMSEDYRQSLPVDAVVVPAKSGITAVAGLARKRFGYPKQLRDYVPVFLTNVGILPQNITLVEASLHELPVKLATVIHLQYYEKLSYKEISLQLGISLKAVESLLVRAKKQLRKKLLKDRAGQGV